MAYSKDFIKRAVAYKQEEHSFEQLREAFNISSTTYYDWVSKLESGFEFGVKVQQERKRKINKQAFRQAIAEKPDAFLEEYARPFNGTPSAVHYVLKSLKITRKKAFTYYERSEKKRAEYNRKVKRIAKNKGEGNID